jgi:hypothetical protein
MMKVIPYIGNALSLTISVNCFVTSADQDTVVIMILRLLDCKADVYQNILFLFSFLID